MSNNEDNVIYVNFSEDQTDEDDQFASDSAWIADFYIKQEKRRRRLSHFLVGSSILTLALLSLALLLMRA